MQITMTKKIGKSTITPDALGVEQILRNTKPPAIIHHLGDLKKVTVDGKTFKRQEEIFISSFGMVKCAPYDNHFLFYDTSHLGWSLFCTCGSTAVVVGYDVYKKDASNQGALLICYINATTRKHMPVNR